MPWCRVRHSSACSRGPSSSSCRAPRRRFRPGLEAREFALAQRGSRALSFARQAPDIGRPVAINRCTGKCQAVVRRVCMKVSWLPEGAAIMPPARQLTRLCPRDLRKGAPKAQVSARKRSGKRTAGSEGGLWRAMALVREGLESSTEGVRLATLVKRARARSLRSKDRGAGEEGKWGYPISRNGRPRIVLRRFANRMSHRPLFSAAFFIGACAGAPGETLGQTHTSI